MRTPEQNLAGVMAYLRDTEPQRDQFEKFTRCDLDSLKARLDYLEDCIAELQTRLDEQM